MAKKKQTSKPPIVVSSHGNYRFLRGMVTATLLQRGLSMDDAFDASRELRDRLSGRKRIKAEELEAEIDELLQTRFGILPPVPVTDTAGLDVPRVVGEEGALPFSRGILVRPLLAAGLTIDDAIPLAEAVRGRLVTYDAPEVAERQVEREVADLLETHHGPGFARRYRLTRWVGRADRPLIVLVGGAAGTGKSTVATELAYRLGIRKVTSTDMIRETMRTVLPAEVLPGLHDHSFRGMLQGGHVLSDPRERVLAGFRQQAAQVAVGIRAVIRRAVREQSHMILEGVHLLPPFVQLASPGARTTLSGVTLAVTGRRKHRSRFVRRSRRQPARAPQTYLDAFQSVRWIHDDLLELADEHDVFVLDNNDDMQSTLNDLVDYLSHAVPLSHRRPTRPLDLRAEGRPATELKTLLLVLDGLADHPCRALEGLTPLAAADTPTFDLLAGAGGLGEIDASRPDGAAPSTATAMMELVAGVDDGDAVGRGVLEALGQGLASHADAVHLRGNLATVAEDGRILDRRAGRIREGTADLLVGLQEITLPGGITGSIRPGHEHRVVVTLRGARLSSAVTDTDPGEHDADPRAKPAGAANKTPEAARTVEALNALLRLAAAHLQDHPLNAERAASGLPVANAILTRGAGAATDVGPAPRAPRAAAVVAACPTALGVARLVGMTPITGVGLTGNLDTDLDAKMDLVADALADHDLVTVHIKGTDIAGHDRRPDAKRDFISAVDAALGQLLASDRVPEQLRVVVTADHGTSSTTGEHVADPVPLLLAVWDPDADPADFDEASARHGALGRVRASELSDLLWGAPEPS